MPLVNLIKNQRPCRNVLAKIWHNSLLIIFCPISTFAVCLVLGSSATASFTIKKNLPLENQVEGFGLPNILNNADAIAYRHIFVLQKSGQWKAADRIIKILEDDILMGHVQFQRLMHPTKYRSSYRELKSWLQRYADHPGAKRVYKLAQRRRPKNYLAPNVPVMAKFLGGASAVKREKKYRSSRKRNAIQRRRIRRITSMIKNNVRREILTKSEEFLSREEVVGLLDVAERDSLLNKVAARWFYRGNSSRALLLASPAANRSRQYFSDADWIAGLSAWRLGKFNLAAQHFEALAHSERATSWSRSAGAFWAARANLASRRPNRVNVLLNLAAEYPRTFYGMIATRQLGRDFELQWNMPSLDFHGKARAGFHPSAHRAIALAQIGRKKLAEKELTRSYLGGVHLRYPMLLAVAQNLDLPAMQLRMARGLQETKNEVYDQALFPIPPWQPTGGFSVDRALLFAFMRQESAFKIRAKSRMGARGLMQLMPRTASFMSGDRTLHRGNKSKLYNPELNLDLGQKYLWHLLQDDLIKGSLLPMVVAYNAGPGNLRKWLSKANFGNDPLLFVEAIPWRESRLFIERVLTNFWIYRERFGKKSPSLDALATSQWPTYINLDNFTKAIEKNAWNR